jgi:hypothetical protein
MLRAGKTKAGHARDTRTMRKREEIKPKSVKKHAGPLIDEMGTDVQMHIGNRVLLFQSSEPLYRRPGSSKVIKWVTRCKYHRHLLFCGNAITFHKVHAVRKVPRFYDISFPLASSHGRWVSGRKSNLCSFPHPLNGQPYVLWHCITGHFKTFLERVLIAQCRETQNR